MRRRKTKTTHGRRRKRKSKTGGNSQASAAETKLLSGVFVNGGQALILALIRIALGRSLNAIGQRTREEVVLHFALLVGRF